MDDDLRALERAFTTTGAREDHARLLAARLRTGALDPARVMLAAHAGHPAAVLAVGAGPPTAVEPWARRFLTHSAAAFARVLLAIARLDVDVVGALVRLEAGERDTVEEVRLRALVAAEEWVACPCDRHARQARADSASAMPNTVGWAASYVGRGLRPGAPDTSPGARWHVDAVVTAAFRLGETAVREAVAREVGDWLLDLRDAVADGAPLRARLPAPLPPPRPTLPPPPPLLPGPSSSAPPAWTSWGGGRVDGIEASDGD